MDVDTTRGGSTRGATVPEVVDHAVVIAGGGPTGLVLAAELRLAGVDALVVERRTTQEVDGSRAGGLHARTLEVLDQRGVVDRFTAAGTIMAPVGFGYAALDLSDVPSRFPHVLALWQRETERLLAGWVLDELGAPIRRGVEVVGLHQDDASVALELSDGSHLRAAYLVGCDGGRSVVRKAAGIDFPGLAPSASWLIAEVEMAEQPVVGLRPGGGGIGPLDPTTPGGPYRVVLKQPPVEGGDEPTVEDLRAALVDAFGTDFGVHDPTWISRFSDSSRQAARYRDHRVLLAGDAAHVHPPMGGQGLNVGVQDAVNLGWKLAQVVHGTAPDALLDTYHDERHPVAARVLHNTEAQGALLTADERHQSLREVFGELAAMDGPRRFLGGMLSGLDVHYDLGGDHPMVGRRVPDLDLETTDGPTRVYEQIHDALGVLLVLGEPGDDAAVAAAAATPWADRVRRVEARCDGPWELPVLGEVAAPAALLVRPDGHVAWVGEPDDPSLVESLERWFGPRDR